MADAAVGGKTGVDLPEGKNLVGAFHVPRLVLADTDVLATLPRRHLRNGLAEIAKMDLLAGVRRGLPRLRRLAAAAGDRAALGRAAARAAFAKAALVARDPVETRGVRVLLNLGHTVGHALEAATGYDGSVLHGEAVAVGMVVAARIAEGRGLLRPGEEHEVATALASLGLPTSLLRSIPGRTVLARVGTDKKRVGGALRMVLPRSAGWPVVVAVGREEIVAALRR
jgi:3-dehydroquinate synthase